MATITSLQIDLSARTARFSEGLQRAQQKVQQFSQRVQVDLQRVTQVGQRAALVFSGMAAGLTLVTKRAADYASTMDKVASQTGIAVEQMQELAFAANQSNADLSSLESGLRAFVRRTAEAAAGNTSFLKGFERLGFTQEQVRAGLQDIDGFLMQVADRVSELGTTAEQSAVLMTIMGDAGRRLVPFMAQGARGIRELREQARELGLVMDEQAVRRLSAFNDRMAILQERTSAARREMAVWFLPAVEAGVGLFEDLIGAIQDIDPALRAHAVRWTVVVGAVLGAVGVLGVLGTAVSQAGALLSAFGRVLSLVFSPMVIYAAIAIGAIALFRTAWENDWLGIRTTATEAWDNYIKPIWEALGEVWEWAIDIAGTAWDWLTETTWAEKVEDIKGWLTAGWEWLVDTAGSAWDWLVNTTWTEKIEDVRGWLKSAWNWTIDLLGDAWEWIEEHLPWLATTIETLADWLSDAWSWTLEKAGEAWDWLDEHAPAVTNTIRNLRDWLSEAWDWTINVLGAGWEWLRNTDWAGIVDKVKQALSSAWDWTINVLGDAWEWLTETTWSEKVEDIKGWLTAGWKWAVDTAGTAWDWLTNTSWADKVEDVRGWLNDTWEWTIDLLGDAWTWIEEHLPWVAATVETLHGLIAAGWDWTIRKAGDAWELLEQGIPEELRELGTVVVNVVFQPFGDLYEAIKQGLETGDWHGIWGATADVWRRGIQIAVSLTLAIKSVQTVLSAIRSGLGLATAGIAGVGVPGVLGTLSILVALAEAREQGDYRKFGQDLIAALAAGIGIGMFTGSPYAGALAFTIVLNFQIGSWIGDTVGSLLDDIGSWIDDQLEPLQQPPIGQVTDIASMYDALRAAQVARGQPAPHVPYGMSGDQLEVEIPATVYIEQVTGLADLGDQPEVEIPAVLRIEQVTGLTGLADILRAIYVAEGGPEARVPYGATGFFDQGHRFSREVNQRRFEELVRSLNLVEGTEDYYAAAASVTVRHYWDTFRREFPEVGERTFAELAPEMQAMFIRYLGQFYAPPEAHPDNVHWVPNVLRGLGLSGYQSGTPWTGWGPTDEVAGVVHRREAVIPWDVLRRGPAAVLEFLGAPGFQAGYIPEDFGGLTGATLVETEPDPGFIARLVESVVGGLESRGIIDPETARSLRELADNLLSIVGGLYDRAVELWDQLGQIDLGEYIDQARRFGEELDALGDVAEQERLAILDRIERLDELVEIERLVAETTGQAFDETAFRAAELSRAITQVARQMFEAEESVEAILEAVAPWVEQLEPLQRQLEVQDAVTTALERLAARLSEVDAGLAELVRSLRWEVGRGFRLDTAGLIQSAIGLVVDLIVDLVDSGAQELRQRLADVPDPGQDILSVADAFRRYSNLDRNIAERQRLLQDLYRQQQAVATRTAGGAAAGGLLGWLVGGPLGAAIGVLFGGGVSNVAAQRDLGPQIEATERQIRELEAQIQGAITDLIQALGIAADDFAAGIAAAFQESDISGFSERLRESVRDTIRQAMVQAFVAQVLEPQITALAEMVQDAFLRGAPLDMEAIDAQIESIVDVSAQLYDHFEQLGLTVERTNEAMSRFVRNIPSGYRVERALFEVSPPRVPAMANGGIVTRPTLALVGEAGPEAVVPLDRGGIGGVYVHIERMEVQDGTDFGRRLDEELRRRGLVRAGNVTAWGGRR